MSQSVAFAHMRGVHCVDCCGELMATLSADRLVAWSLRRSSGRFAEVSRVSSPLRESSTPAGVCWLRDRRSVVPYGDCQDASISIMQMTPAGLQRAASLQIRGATVNRLVEIADTADETGSAPSRIVAANANRAFLFDRRAGPQPCARLALQGITGLASSSDARSASSPPASSPPALLAAAGSTILVFDVRKLPEDTKLAKRPPALATLTAGPDGLRNESLKDLAVLGNVVVATATDDSLSVWDVGTQPANGAETTTRLQPSADDDVADVL